SIRAQMLALPLYTALLWLLASEARAPSRRVWLAFPLLVVWANIHRSVALRAPLVILFAAYQLVPPPRPRLAPSPPPRVRPLLAPPPRRAPAARRGRAHPVRYSHLILVAPPFAGRVTEWSWAAPATNTMFFYVLAAIAVVLVWLGRRRLTAFDMLVLGLTL